MRFIKIFISSSQEEFETFRRDLKEAIDNEEFVHKRIMRGILVEQKTGASIEDDIRKGIDESAIYVGIFGRIYSERTVSEFKEARAQGLPLLIYQFKRGRRRGKPKRHEKRGRKSKVLKFLEAEVKALDIRVRGPFQSAETLESIILADLADQVSQLVQEVAIIRKTIHK